MLFRLLLFAYICFYSSFSVAINYTCKINNQCLNHLRHKLLNKESHQGIYKACHLSYEQNKNCCKDPFSCQERGVQSFVNFFKRIYVNQYNTSSCELKRISALMDHYSGVKDTVCRSSIERCKKNCNTKLEELKHYFRQCFHIPVNVSIKSVLNLSRSSAQSQPPKLLLKSDGQRLYTVGEAELSEYNCYSSMREVIELYKNQTRDKISLLRDNITSGDIVKCEGLPEKSGDSDLRNFISHILCPQAQVQEQNKELEKRRRELEAVKKLTAEEERRVQLEKQATSSSTSGCSIIMPEIKSTVVFQSVEAPQIEPMQKQARLPYDDYDLVKGKPAGVLVELNIEPMDENEDFVVGFSISENKKYYNKCLNDKGKLTFDRGAEKPCVFNKALLQNSHSQLAQILDNPRVNLVAKFLPFPMEEAVLDKEGKYQINVSLSPLRDIKNCSQTKSFTINVIETAPLKVGFARFFDKNLECDLRVSPNRLKKIVSKSDFQDFMPAMYPVRTATSSIVGYSHEGKNYSYIKGSCREKNKENDHKPELFRRIRDMAEIREHLAYSAVMGVVDELDMLNIHHRIIPGKAYSAKGVAFMTDQLGTNIPNHELGHILGQRKEFYLSKYKCQRFRGTRIMPCPDYKISRGLHVNNRWNFYFDRFSIMQDTSLLYTVWIDRDTYQKAFKTLRDTFLKTGKKETGYLLENPSAPKVVISGYYNRQNEKFTYPKISFYNNTKITTPSVYSRQTPVVTFQLREGNRILKQIIRPAEDVSMEIFYKNKASETERFPMALVMGKFPLPSNYKNRNLSIFVFSPERKLIYKTPVFPKQNIDSIELEEVAFSTE